MSQAPTPQGDAAARRLPEQLAEVVEEFAELEDRQKLELLLEFSRELPELPARYLNSYDQMEEVVECQSPLFLTLEYDDAAGTAAIFFAAPPEAPTTRGFAAILHEGLSGLRFEEILAVPEDLSERLGLSKAITPLRLRGMTAMLGRIKRNIRVHLAASAPVQGG
ncbi:SufE family protein [Nesterenkonia sp. LB17]|uniref:SufE family protein n=1 Tax=unclassified Nesterenkonia TaxID=2629769 RepID=UPI001F4CA417|nr:MULTISPECIES: SufE family protein [unclassified Nesterenkonia]MCH8561305.1 SufE family protein [Nesterenkonia sp. DZ6]MCH8562381.1 SufE family protein [Nesterenkonia sp. YGD6]MCH8565317.1 SufE family protein [Nesterenkonia sp. LB17]MCH8571235.1 SufE family protein [Nesterenkonia sp. AY15]